MRDKKLRQHAVSGRGYVPPVVILPTLYGPRGFEVVPSKTMACEIPTIRAAAAARRTIFDTIATKWEGYTWGCDRQLAATKYTCDDW